MLNRNTELIKDEDTRQAINFILEEGMGNPIILESEPAAGVPLLNANEWGVYSGKVYIRKAQIIYVVPSSTITII